MSDKPERKSQPSSPNLLIFNGAILTGCAVFIAPGNKFLLSALMLFLPLLEARYRQPDIKSDSKRLLQWSVILVLMIGMALMAGPSHMPELSAIILFTALPEEWFFRRYIQQKLTQLFQQESGLYANLLTSVFFAVLHLPTQGIQGLSVFFPSLFLGWLYQSKRDIILVILVHSLFNLVYIIYLREIIQAMVNTM